MSSYPWLRWSNFNRNVCYHNFPHNIFCVISFWYLIITIFFIYRLMIHERRMQFHSPQRGRMVLTWVRDDMSIKICVIMCRLIQCTAARMTWCRFALCDEYYVGVRRGMDSHGRVMSLWSRAPLDRFDGIEPHPPSFRMNRIFLLLYPYIRQTFLLRGVLPAACRCRRGVMCTNKRNDEDE